MVSLECKFCESEIEVPKSWIIHNGRVFCGCCCKSFEVRLGEEILAPVNKDAQVEIALEELEKEIDKAIEEYEIPDTDDFSWF